MKSAFGALVAWVCLCALILFVLLFLFWAEAQPGTCGRILCLTQ